jgi:hypothetical protein
MFQRVDAPPGGRTNGHGSVATLIPFMPLFVKLEHEKWFTCPRNRQKAAIMDRREEHALNEVDRIGVAVEHLRDLLLAATKAELRANSRQRAAEAPGDR